MKGYEKSSSGLVFASETCAFDLMNAKTVNEIQPGEMIAYDIKNGGWTSSTPLKKKTSSKCVFELIYFARPDSQIFNKQVYETRKALGRRLAQEQPAEADLVVPVPDSGIPAAIGYAEESKTPFESAIIRSHYIKRTFIQPQQAMRDLGVRLKLNAIRSCISGKRVVVVDDSLVRGTTSRKIISMLKECGARQIHFRISAPPTISPCFYGIDTPHKDQLIASKSSIEEIRQYIGADTIGYLSREGLSQVSGSGCCDACFSGDYPTLVQLSHK
jgi:amidophosphoribosyltransferase